MQILYDVHAKPLKQNAKLAIIPQFFLKILDGCVIGLILSMNEKYRQTKRRTKIRLFCLGGLFHKGQHQKALQNC